MECLAVPVFGLLIIGMLMIHSQHTAKHKDALASVAALHDGLVVKGDEVQGNVGPAFVHIDTYTTGSGKSKSTWTRFRITDPTALSSGSVGQEGLFSGVGKLVQGDDIQVGDPKVDGALLLRGMSDDIVARFGPEARKAVTKAVVHGWELSGGTWMTRRRGRMTNALEMQRVMALGMDTVISTRLPGTVAQALMERALFDPLQTARLRCVEELIADNHRFTDAQREQLLASGGLVALAMAESMGSDGVPTLRRALQGGSGEIRLRAALALAKVGEGGLTVESTLLAALQVDEYRPLAIEALGAVGTVESVPRLTPIAEEWMGSSRHEARAAIRAIQSRLVGAEAGQVSLVETVGGEVSVADPAQDGTRGAQAQARRTQTEG